MVGIRYARSLDGLHPPDGQSASVATDRGIEGPYGTRRRIRRRRGSRDSTRPIRALLRGLEVLTTLNLHNGATVTEIADQIRLPRTTTYRILETLGAAGYVYRDEADDRYRLTIQVRGLSEGFDDEAWVTQIAHPHLQALGRELATTVAPPA